MIWSTFQKIWCSDDAVLINALTYKKIKIKHCYRKWCRMDICLCTSLRNSTLLMQYVLYQNTHITMHSKTVCLGKIQDIYSDLLKNNKTGGCRALMVRELVSSSSSSFRSGRNCGWGEWITSALFQLQYHDWGALEQGTEPQLLPGHCSINSCPLLRVCVHDECVHCCVCTLDGLMQTEHKFRVWV